MDEAHGLAKRALDLAVRYGERGHEAWALRWLGGAELESGESSAIDAVRLCQRGLAIADELGMRPLAGHLRAVLGRACSAAWTSRRRSRKNSIAATLFRASDMPCWAEQTELEPAKLN